jgi:aminoglycoside 6'-N-acetyltransferase
LDDAPRIAAYRSDPVVALYVPWEPPYTVERATAMVAAMAGKRFEEPGDGLIMAVEAGGVLIGDAMIKHEMAAGVADARQGVIGYVIAPEHAGRGYATELARGLIGRYFEDERAHRVTAWCDARNGASQRVLVKAGMRREALFVRGVFAKGEWVDECVYAALKEDWRAGSAESLT